MKNKINRKIKTTAAGLCAVVGIMAACPMTSLAYSSRVGDWSNYYTNGHSVRVGDCNEDGNVNMADYVILSQYVADLHGSFLTWWRTVWSFGLTWNDHYDINGDGQINQSDVNDLRDYVIDHGRF